jgi:DNA-binding MarR family transcriptional regulator
VTDLDLTDSVLEFWRRLRRADRDTRRALGLGLEQYTLLRRIAGHGPQTVGQLASHMSVTSSSMTTALKRLEAQGLVRRERQDDDQRLVRVVLTAAGVDADEQFQRARRAVVATLAVRLDAGEQAELARLLAHMVEERSDGD